MKIIRISYVAFTLLFYYLFLGSYFSFDLAEHPETASHIAAIAPVFMLLIAAFFTPFIIGWGIFLFFKYHKQKKGDFWHYCLIYPGFAIFAIAVVLLIWKVSSIGF